MVRLRQTVICLGQFLQGRNKTGDLAMGDLAMLPASLKSRLNTAISLTLSDPSTLLVLTGGDVAGVGCSEARAMHDYYVSTTLPQVEVLIEDRSRNTVENALNCKTLLSKLGAVESFNVTVVTNDFHMPRARLVFRSVFNTTEVCCVGAATCSDVVACIDKELEFLPNLPKYLRDRYNLTELPTPRAVSLAMQELAKMRQAALITRY